MLEALRFVQGAVAKKDFVQALTHFSISKGLIKGYNGSMALCSPIALDLDVMPKAVPFTKAIQTCKDTVQIHLTPGNRLAIKSGPFRAFVDCTEEPYPDLQPEGEKVELGNGFLKAMKRLEPFIADDASRPWARGILFLNQSAYATNNITLVEYWLGYTFPVAVNIPKPAVTELLRIGEEPTHLQLTETSVTFHFSENRWLRTQTYSTAWPDVTKILWRESKQLPFPNGFFQGLLDLKPFVGELETVYFTEHGISTEPLEGKGASVDIPDLPEGGAYAIKQLALLEGLADTIDFGAYPAPSLFYGPGVRGALVGQRR